MAATPTPYQINVPQSKLDNLKSKLANATFPDEVQDAGWDLGSPLADVKRLAKKWETWDWRAAEKKLNEVPMFEMPVNVDGFGDVDIHFVWQKSNVEGAIPLLFVHGWPGSFIEVLKLLPDLSQPSSSAPAFDIIAPSLPNYGFSQGIATRGFRIAQYAEVCHKLMLSLNYPEYVTQGGDWGSMITRAIGAFYPSSCKGSHINLILAAPPQWTKNPILALQHSITPYSEKEKKGLMRTQWFRSEGMGYNLEQSTKPQTLAYALHDSPVALLAWIYEKLHDWTDSHPWTDDEILTWISIYQFSRAGPGAAHRIYYETLHTPPSTPDKRTFGRADIVSHVPTVPLGLCFNPMELSVLPKTWARTLGRVVYESEQESGGHFCATEHPEVIVKDLRAMFGKGGGAFGVVRSRNGYGKRAQL